MTALYAYAFVPAASTVPDGLAGLGPQPAPVRLVGRDRVGVLVSDVDADRLSGLLDTDLTEDSELVVRAREHDLVVRTAAGHGPVLPFRFGTVLRDDAAVDRLLAQHHDAALALLAHVDGRQEWGVTLHAQRPADDDPSTSDRTSGAAYLASRGRRLHDMDERRTRQRDVADSIRHDLASWVADLADRRGGDAVLDVAVLIDRTAERDFLAHVGQLAVRAADGGLQLTTTGPWPPYSFTDTTAEADDG